MSEMPKISATPPALVSNGRSDKTGSAAGNAPEKSNHVTRPSAPPPSTTGVSVSVSPAVSQWRQASAADVDQKKVQSVRMSIAKGTFKVNAEVIADKMLANAEEMLQKKSH